ncbi:hypothetical protein PsYK624_162430 [Phanerochaete sordida]|uniref:Uncharacterized protein n=1 Tax=Phanerochaete sordida TaxID=48140 RepID=A0A9P3GR38_9APHY|nr:hypothetical protein PsYK624_162430 [Phanerochaete sordida]
MSDVLVAGADTHKGVLYALSGRSPRGGPDMAFSGVDARFPACGMVLSTISGGPSAELRCPGSNARAFSRRQRAFPGPPRAQLPVRNVRRMHSFQMLLCSVPDQSRFPG